jgi:hypothetical protein
VILRSSRTVSAPPQPGSALLVSLQGCVLLVTGWPSWQNIMLERRWNAMVSFHSPCLNYACLLFWQVRAICKPTFRRFPPLAPRPTWREQWSWEDLLPECVGVFSGNTNSLASVWTRQPSSVACGTSGGVPQQKRHQWAFQCSNFLRVCIGKQHAMSSSSCFSAVQFEGRLLGCPLLHAFGLYEGDLSKIKKAVVKKRTRATTAAPCQKLAAARTVGHLMPSRRSPDVRMCAAEHLPKVTTGGS